MATKQLNSGGINYNQVPPTANPNGSLTAVDWEVVTNASWQNACDTIRAGGGEVLQYILPVTDYPDSNRSRPAVGNFYGGTRSQTQSRGWFWDNSNPSRALVVNYNGYAMDMRPGSAWILQVVAYCKARMADPNWDLDGFFLDVTGDASNADAFTGFTAAEKETFKAGNRDMCLRLRAALGPNVILMNNNFWSGANQASLDAAAAVNGVCIEHHAYPGVGGWLDAYLARCTNPKRRHLAIVQTNAELQGYQNTLVTHGTIQPSGSNAYSVHPAYPQGSPALAQTWPADWNHLAGYDSTTDSGTSGGGGGEPPPVDLPDPPDQPSVTIGSRNKGINKSGSTADYKRGYKVTVPADTYSGFRVLIDGQGTTSGTQTIRGVLYTDSAGAPNALQVSSNDVTINANDAPAWVSLPFASNQALAAGDYWFVLHTGATSLLSRYYWDPVTGASRGNADTFVGGATNPFGTPDPVGQAQLSMYLVKANVTGTALSGTSATTSTSGANLTASSGPLFPNKVVAINRQVLLPVSEVVLYEVFPDNSLGAEVEYDESIGRFVYVT